MTHPLSLFRQGVVRVVIATGMFHGFLITFFFIFELYLFLVRNLGFGYQCPGQNDCILWRFAISNSFDGEFLEFIANFIEFLTPL